MLYFSKIEFNTWPVWRSDLDILHDDYILARPGDFIDTEI